MSVQGLHVGTFSLIVLVALCSCRPVVGSSLLEWMGISSWSDSHGKEVTVQDGTPLLKVPFEEATPEDKFLREAEKLVGLKTSQLDTCQHKVVMKIQSSCASISEEELAKLSVNLLNCQSAVEGRQQFPCTEKMSLRDCTNKMDSDMWNTYHLMNNRARAVCYAARHQQFRALSEMTVNRLMRTANEQLQTMDLLRDGQTKLESLTSGTLESVSKGHQTLLAEQEKLRSTQQSVHDFVALNLRELTREKALIAAGQRELSLMTREVKAKLDDASLQLSNHASEHQKNHLQVLKDLENLQRKAFEIWDQVDLSTKQILNQHAEAADDLDKMLNNMARINSSIEYLLKTVEKTRLEIDERLGWIIKFITESGDQLEWIQHCLAHGLYLVLGMIATSFIQAPSAVRCALILVVPLNLALTSYEGAEGALDFSGLTLLLILFSGVNWFFSSLHEWFITQGNSSRQTPICYAPLQNGTGLNGQVPTQSASDIRSNVGFVDSCLLQLSSAFSSFKNKVSAALQKLSSMLKNLAGRLKEETTPINVSLISNDEVDEGDSSDNEGSVEQEIRLSSRRLLPQGRLYNSSVLRSDSPASSRSSQSFTPSRSGTLRNLCQRLTVNGNPCKKLALPNSDACHTHSLSSPARDAIIRGGLRHYTDQLGHLWNSLADYYLRSGLFERARDIYEEAIQTVKTVRDFTQVFDAYAQFEELSLSKRFDQAQNVSNPSEEDDVELDLRLARFEHLMERRPLLLNSVLLRQNPHNVHEWHKRVQLYEGQPHQIISTYTEAVQTVDPKLAVGKLNSLWVAFAKFYEENGQLDDARVVFEKATQVPYVKVEDLAAVWCEWAEMEIRHERPESALKLMHKATVMPNHKAAYHDETETVQNRLYKSLKLWSLYADLEESFGSFKSCKAVYDHIIDLKIATPQIIINYGLFLEEQNYFEEAFKAYEKGIALFRWPNVYDIWNTYLTKFLNCYGGTKLERARDLFEQCLEKCPPKFAKGKKKLCEMFNIYIKKAAEIYGVPKTRQIYEKAIEMLDDNNSRFAEMETKLGEVDRARAIYAHCSQICDPRVTADFWQAWKDFEVRHGDEDTMREMLRIKCSVQATYNTQVNMMSAQMVNVSGSAGTVADLAPAPGVKDGMRMLEAKAAEVAQMESRLVMPKGGNILFVRGETQGGDREGARVANPDEIELDEEDKSEKEEVAELPIQKQIVPSEVFGSLKQNDDDDDDDKEMA